MSEHAANTKPATKRPRDTQDKTVSNQTALDRRRLCDLCRGELIFTWILLSRRQPSLHRELHRLVDRDPDDTGVLVHPAVTVEHLVLARAQLAQILRGFVCRRGSGGTRVSWPAASGYSGSTRRASRAAKNRNSSHTTQ